MFARLRALSAAALLVAATAPAPALAAEVLVMDSDTVLNTSAVGEDIKAKLAEIAQSMDEELKAEGSPVKAEWDQFQAEIAPLDRAALSEREDLQARGQEIQQKIVSLSVSEQIKARELVATRQQALQPVREALDEVLKEIVEERSADILVERDILIFSSEAVDITAAVIEKLNAKLTSVEVERVTINLEDQAGDAG
ncbi:MAG: OmpH family outer membrane protein [Caulobacterales bacterium]|nr:OmpH family outer membrane protein [Caulobacterales bacterium]